MPDEVSIDLGPDTWDDVDSYVRALVREMQEDPFLTLTEAFVYRERQCAGVLALPGLVIEESGRILARLREIVPQTLPDEVVVLLAWPSSEPEGLALGVRDLRWTRAEDRWEGTLHLARRGDQSVSIRVPLDLDNMIEHEVVSMFDGVVPTGLLDLRDLKDDEAFLVHRDGPFAELGSLCEWHQHE